MVGGPVDVETITLSFRDAPLGAGPKSILPAVVMDSGLVLRTPRNDDEIRPRFGRRRRCRRRRRHSLLRLTRGTPRWRRPRRHARAGARESARRFFRWGWGRCRDY